MIRIVPEFDECSQWSPTARVITLPKKSSKYYEHLPSVLAHEIGHVREGHDLSGLNVGSLTELYQERDAWMSAVRRMAPEEIEPEFVNSTIGTYVREVLNKYGEDSEQYKEAKRIRRELMDYVRRRARG